VAKWWRSLFSQQPNWHYLLGTRSQLRPVWKSYYIGTDAAEVPDSPAAGSSAPSPDQVEHTALVYLIDPQQRLRAALDASFTVADFVHDVRAIAR
jgi:cytochrome oxidase Cu insertion factor (SCO1/SenC/PrrC family)